MLGELISEEVGEFEEKDVVDGRGMLVVISESGELEKAEFVVGESVASCDKSLAITEESVVTSCKSVVVVIVGEFVISSKCNARDVEADKVG